MGKNGLKLRIKKLDTGYAVQQQLRKHHILYWQTLEVYDDPEQALIDFPYLGVERSLSKLRAL